MLTLLAGGGGVGSLGVQIAAALFQLPSDIVASQLPMAAPIPSSLAEVAQRKIVDDLMDEESEPWATFHGYEIDDDLNGDVVNEKMAESKKIDHHKPSTYGEVTTKGARQLFYHMGMSGKVKDGPSDQQLRDEIIFYDLGSGVGKLVVQAYMELPRVSRAIGIELAPFRHQHAVAAWDELESSARDARDSREDTPKATVDFFQEDIFEADISKATHLYVSSLCFSDDMMHQLATKLELEGQNLQCIASIKPFPADFHWKGVRDRINYEVIEKVLKLGMTQRSEFVEMSWTAAYERGCEVTIYTKSQ